MKKHVFGKKFSRDTNERRALFKNLISSLVLNERIQTTEAKAKAIKGDAEKAVTKVKKNGEIARRLLGDVLNSKAMEKMVNDIAPRFKNRNGGYTRIIRVGKRFGDNAMEVILEWTEGPSSVRPSHVADAARPRGSKIQRSKPSSLSVRRTTKAKPKTKPVRRSASSPSASVRASRGKKGKKK